MYEPDVIKSIFWFIKWSSVIVGIIFFVGCSYYLDHVRFNW